MALLQPPVAAGAPPRGAGAEGELLERIARFAGPDLRLGTLAEDEEEKVSLGACSKEVQRQRLLEQIASGGGDPDPKERELHQHFVQAKEDRELAVLDAFEQAKEEWLALSSQEDTLRQQAREDWNARRMNHLVEQRLRRPQQRGEGAGPAFTDEEYREWGYPEMDPKFRDREWHRQQMELDRTDPRHNPNLLLDQDHPEFWAQAARKPFSRAILKAEKHWNHRRGLWMEQYESVELMNAKRQEIAARLEDCSAETKRLLTPILRYSVTQNMLADVLDESRRRRLGFREMLEDIESRESLKSLRKRIDDGGDAEAEAALLEYVRKQQHDQELQKRDREGKDGPHGGRVLADAETLCQAMNLAGKCKKDGLLEWEKGNVQEARESWREADKALRKFKARDGDPANEKIMELHCSVLKNLAQACIKLEDWTEAVQAAEAALRIEPDDHKAWFRKACAMEGLGKLDEAEACLRRVDDCSVGRPDRARLAKDVEVRRGKLQALRDREEVLAKRMGGRAVGGGVFSSAREKVLPIEQQLFGDLAPLQAASRPAAQAPRAGAAGALPPAVGAPPPPAAARKVLTREAAEDLLDALCIAYREPAFQKQVTKLARDVRLDKREFLLNLKRIALPVQGPILRKWGFQATDAGVQEMSRAVRDLTTGQRAVEAVKKQSEEAAKALYGCMYEVIRNPDRDVEVQLPQSSEDPQELSSCDEEEAA